MPELTLLAEMVSDFKQGFPDVKLSSELDIEEWKQADPNASPADRPLFVTLPLVKVGTTSQNGLQWGRPEAEHLVKEINSKRPEGGLGHTPAEKRSTEYKLPSLRWVGALLADDGTVWGKAYVPKYASDVREFFIDAKRARARVGTSVYGMQGDKGLRDMTLEQIDIGHPDRISHPVAAAVPKLTSELQNTDNDKTGEDKHPMPEKDELTLVAELSKDKTNALAQVSELTSKLTAHESLISELKKRDEGLKAVESLVAEFKGETVAAKINTLISELVDLRKAAQKATIDGWIADALKAVELKDLHPVIVAEMGAVDSADKAKARVAELMAQEHIKVIAEALAVKKMGPRAFVGATGKNGAVEFDESPEAVAASRALTGI